MPEELQVVWLSSWPMSHELVSLENERVDDHVEVDVLGERALDRDVTEVVERVHVGRDVAHERCVLVRGLLLVRGRGDVQRISVERRPRVPLRRRERTLQAALSLTHRQREVRGGTVGLLGLVRVAGDGDLDVLLALLARLIRPVAEPCPTSPANGKAGRLSSKVTLS